MIQRTTTIGFARLLWFCRQQRGMLRKPYGKGTRGREGKVCVLGEATRKEIRRRVDGRSFRQRLFYGFDLLLADRVFPSASLAFLPPTVVFTTTRVVPVRPFCARTRPAKKKVPRPNSCLVYFLRFPPLFPRREPLGWPSREAATFVRLGDTFEISFVARYKGTTFISSAFIERSEINDGFTHTHTHTGESCFFMINFLSSVYNFFFWEYSKLTFKS